MEVGFLCILVAPFWNHYRAKPSDGVTLWAVRWLLFRLMFASGVVKLTSGCPLWWKLDGKIIFIQSNMCKSNIYALMMAHLYFIALNIHFESQCIPMPLAWYAHHLPTWFLRLSTVAVNVIELAVPFLFFFPNRNVRLIACHLQVCNNCL